MHPYSDIPLLLLCGVGRSGTMALREALGRHPLVHSTESENNILYDVLDAAGRNCVAESRRFAMRVDDTTYDALFRNLLLHLLWPRPRPETPQQLLAFSALSPDRALYLRRLFAGARVVYLVRNGIEVVSSRMRHHGFADQPFTQHCDFWAEAADMARWGETRGDFRLIRHEDLLAADSVERVLDELWSWAGLPAEQACIDHILNVTHHPTGGETPAATPADNLRDRPDRWRQWSAVRRRQFAERCRDAMHHFGYPIPWEQSPVLTDA